MGTVVGFITVSPSRSSSDSKSIKHVDSQILNLLLTSPPVPDQGKNYFCPTLYWNRLRSDAPSTTAIGVRLLVTPEPSPVLHRWLFWVHPPTTCVTKLRNRRRTRCRSVPGLVHTSKVVEVNFNLGAKDFWSRFTDASDHAAKSSANYFLGAAVQGDTTLPSADHWVFLPLAFTILLLISLHDFPCATRWSGPGHHVVGDQTRLLGSPHSAFPVELPPCGLHVSCV